MSDMGHGLWINPLFMGLYSGLYLNGNRLSHAATCKWCDLKLKPAHGLQYFATVSVRNIVIHYSFGFWYWDINILVLFLSVCLWLLKEVLPLSLSASSDTLKSFWLRTKAAGLSGEIFKYGSQEGFWEDFWLFYELVEVLPSLVQQEATFFDCCCWHSHLNCP